GVDLRLQPVERDVGEVVHQDFAVRGEKRDALDELLTRKLRTDDGRHVARYMLALHMQLNRPARDGFAQSRGRTVLREQQLEHALLMRGVGGRCSWVRELFAPGRGGRA